MERRRLRVYIAGPISKGDTVENVWHGIRWGKRMLQDGLAPYIPHLDAYMTLAAAAESPGESDEWRALLEWDIEWVAASEAFFRLTGESKGADLEMKIAKELGLPVFHETRWNSDFSREHDPERRGFYIDRYYDPDWPDYDDLLAYARGRQLRGVRQYA